DTWWEYVGDISSAKNVFLMALPYAVHTTSPRLASIGVWNSTDVSLAGELRASGELINGTEAVARTVGWHKALAWSGGKPGGKQLVELITKYHEHLEKRG